MEELMEAIESVKRIDANPRFSSADRHLAHILLEDAAHHMRVRIAAMAASILASEPTV